MDNLVLTLVMARRGSFQHKPGTFYSHFQNETWPALKDELRQDDMKIPSNV